ncbi:Oxysterol-binding protein-domain-containing protein [Amylostereum chailletii]|nr:Oxysterol-binding protein-domain-containing protein [Amylostereum chailletii]
MAVYAVTSSPLALPNPQGIVYEGWVLKKRRKKRQGFARRYFVLHESGVLSYSFEPGKPARDQILLQQAAISTARNTKDIHVDSNNATFHVQCLNTDDFDKWMVAFRPFIAPPADARSIGRKSSVRRVQSRLGQVNKTSVMIDELGLTISQLENAIEEWNSSELTRRTPSLSKSKDNGSKFGIFKKSHHAHPSPPSSPDEKGSLQFTPYDHVQTMVGSLKAQQSALAKMLSAMSNSDAAHGSSLPTTAEEARDRSATPTRHSTLPVFTYQKNRGSVVASISDGDSVWFDAPEGEPEGAEEFLLDEPSSLGAMESLGSRLTNTDSHSTIYAGSQASDTDEEEQEVRASLEVEEAPSGSSVEVARRTSLPSGPVGDEGSLFAILKKNIGKDLSSITFPVTFNEPLTLLQRAAEEVEYYDLLSEAAQTQDAVERLCYVAAFAVSGYAHTRHRSSRKGFNPLLAETFEDPRLRFISEKVSHNPVILAYHAEGEGWEMYATSSGKTKFWGKSLEIIPTGNNHVKIGDDHYQWKRPSSFMRNLMMGTKYLEHSGKMVIENLSTKARCVIEFKENGYWDSSNIVTGTVFSSSGKVDATLEGNWDAALARKLDSSHLHVLWRATPFPKNSLEQYGLTSWAVTLNEITLDTEGKLPPTDSRYRPDVRALEEGELDLAESEKARVEEAQRERRRDDKTRQPRWFKQDGDEWFYVGGYWEQRSKGWKAVEPLW